MSSNTQNNDHPFWLVVKNCMSLVKSGAVIYQKFTCAGCGARLGMEAPNKIYTHGDCDACGAVTNILMQGCNYMVAFSSGREARAALHQEKIPEMLIVVECEDKNGKTKLGSEVREKAPSTSGASHRD